jgi:hypothetical protein
MTERIDLKALKEAAEKVMAANAANDGLALSAALDEFDYLCTAETVLGFVAVVEAALELTAHGPNAFGVLDEHTALVQALHPFTEST